MKYNQKKLVLESLQKNKQEKEVRTFNKVFTRYLKKRGVKLDDLPLLKDLGC